MDFGERVEPAALHAAVEASEWLTRTVAGAWGTVGSLVPTDFPSTLRVHAPSATAEDWWVAYRQSFTDIVAEAATLSGDDGQPVHIAVWDGHGFDQKTTHIAYREPPADDAQRRQRDRARERLLREDTKRNAAINSFLERVPVLARPHRNYYLLAGPLSAVSDLRYPDDADHWRNPDLFWPLDRSWFVATDVDFWSLYVAGSDELLDGIERRAATPTERVDSTTPLPIEH